MITCIRLFLFAIIIVAPGTALMAQEPVKTPSEMSAHLRQMVLSLDPADIGITPKSYPHSVWGVLMETGDDAGAVTLSVLADGAVSIYFSTGGGVIGAGEHESVRRQARAFLVQANVAAVLARPSSTQPLPRSGQTTFYFLTREGVRAYSAPETSLGEGRDRLSELFYAGHAVISEVRKLHP